MENRKKTGIIVIAVLLVLLILTAVLMLSRGRTPAPAPAPAQAPTEAPAQLPTEAPSPEPTQESEAAPLSRYWSETSLPAQELRDYVAKVTDPAKDSFIPEKDRIAVFDMDGTLTCETYYTYYDTMMFIEYCLKDHPDKVSDELKEVAASIEPGYKADEALARNFAKASSLSPTANPFTLLPTSSMRPQISWPTTESGRTPFVFAPVKILLSVPQRAAAFILRRISFSPQTGLSIWVTS